MEPVYDTLPQAIIEQARTLPHQTFTFLDLEGAEASRTFEEVEVLTAARCAELHRRGLRRGDRVGLAVIEPEDFVLTFLSCLRMGAIPVPLYPPLSMGRLDAYAERTAKILSMAGARTLMCSRRLQIVLGQLLDRVPSLTTVMSVEDLRAARGTPPSFPDISQRDVAFLQFTSGSTADPKGVVVTHGSLRANTHAIGRRMKLTREGTTSVTWLPLYHDMGLIGFLATPYLHGIRMVFIPTLRFLAAPASWMDVMHEHRGTYAFAPNFAYGLLTRRCSARRAAKWDLSCVRVLGCGGEPVHAGTLSAFARHFAEHSRLDPGVLMPAYGMAEATLAVTMRELGQGMRTKRVNPTRFGEQGLAVDPEGDEVVEHVSCGPVVDGHEVSIRDEAGRVVSENAEGEIWFRGPSVAAGYWGNEQATANTFVDGWLRTGDLGYLRDGELYATGRVKDLLIVNGRNVHPQTVEWAAVEVKGVRKGNAVAFTREGPHSEELVVALETRSKDHEQLRAAVRERVLDEVGVQVTDVVCLGSGQLPKTSSGKVRRADTRALYLSGALGSDPAPTRGMGAKLNLAAHALRSSWSHAKATLSREPQRSTVRTSAGEATP